MNNTDESSPQSLAPVHARCPSNEAAGSACTNEFSKQNLMSPCGLRKKHAFSMIIIPRQELHLALQASPNRATSPNLFILHNSSFILPIPAFSMIIIPRQEPHLTLQASPNRAASPDHFILHNSSFILPIPVFSMIIIPPVPRNLRSPHNP